MRYETHSGRWFNSADQGLTPKSRKKRSEDDADTPLFPARHYPEFTFRRKKAIEEINNRLCYPCLTKYTKSEEAAQIIVKHGQREPLIRRMLFDIDESGC